MNKNKLIGELAARCVAMNCDTLHVFFDYQGHVNQIVIYCYMGGWSKSALREDLAHFYLEDDEAEFKIKLTLSNLDELQVQHDKLYAPENLAATQEAARLAKIAELQKQIEELS